MSLPVASGDVADAATEKAYAAERRLAALRLLVVLTGTVLYPLFVDRTGTLPWLAYTLLALAWVYGLVVYLGEPYRRHPLLLSGSFLSITDATFTMLWLHATGGFESPFFVILYPSVIAVAFRFPPRETLLAAVAYAAGYVTLVAIDGALDAHSAEILVRIVYIYLSALLGAIVSREVLAQTAAKVQLRERLQAGEARARLAAELERREKLLAEAQEIAQIGSWDWDAVADRVSWSPVLYRIFGLDPDAFSASYAAFIERVHPDDRNRIDQVIRDAGATGVPFDLEHRIVRPDGSIRWVHGRGQAIRDDAGRLLRMAGTAQDITGKKEAGEDLRRAHELLEQRVRDRTAELWSTAETLRAVVEAAPVALVSLDLERRVTMWNPAAERLFGWTAEEVLGRPLPTVPDDQTGSFDDQISATLAGRPATDVEIVRRRNNGARLELVISRAPQRDSSGRIVGVVGAMVDITERKRTEADRALLAAIVESSADAIISRDWQGRITSWNAGATKMYGFTPAETLGRSVEFLVPPDLLGELGEIDQSVRRGEVVQVRQTRRRTKDGRTIDVSLTLSPLTDAAGQRIGIAGIGRDITDQKRADEERTRLLADLESAVRARDMFLSIASHELKTPVSALQLQTEMLLRSLRKAEAQGTPADLATLRGRGEAIFRQLDRLTKLIANLLDVSRITAGKLALEVEEVDLTALTREVLGRHDEEARRAGSMLTLEAAGPSGGSVVGRWDRLRLEQVLTNLLSNAIKYGAGKPIEVIVETAGDAAVLTVRDHGIGIAPEDQARVFDRFERLVSVRHYGGFGLGLWIVRQVVEALGGTIRVVSTVGAGSSFIVELPLGIARTAALAAPAPGAGDAGILLVEDDLDILQSVSEILRLEGYPVTQAANGQEALEQLIRQRRRPSLILLDLMMPGMNGWQFLDRLRQMPEFSTVPVVLLSADGNIREKATELQAVGYVPKPVHIATLVETVQRHYA